MQALTAQAMQRPGHGIGPRVSVGLPVFNGGNYLAEALDALRAQTYAGFELVIVDNGSTDDTPAICRRHAAADPRIRYLRSERNRGAAWSQNETIRQSRGELFKLAAHDDICLPGMLQGCIERLDADPDVVLAYPAAKIMENDDRSHLRYWQDRIRSDSPHAPVRFADLIGSDWLGFRIFGVVRRAHLLRTGLFGPYQSADDIVLIRLALAGRFHEVPERTFIYRRHPAQSIATRRSARAYNAWWDPERGSRRAFPTWRLLREIQRSVARAPIGTGDRLRCHGHLLRWVRRRRLDLWRELATRGDGGDGGAPWRAETDG